MKYPKNTDFISCKTYMEVKRQLWGLLSKHHSDHGDKGREFHLKWKNKSFFGVPSLGIDWIREESRRANRKVDVYYLNRSGDRLRSLNNLTEYLFRHSGYHLSGFNFIEGVFDKSLTEIVNYSEEQDNQQDNQKQKINDKSEISDLQLAFNDPKLSKRSKKSSRSSEVDEELGTEIQKICCLRDEKSKIGKVRSRSSLLDEKADEENGFDSNKRRKKDILSEKIISVTDLNIDSNKTSKKLDLFNEIHESQIEVMIIAGDQRNILDEEKYSLVVVDVSPEMVLEDGLDSSDNLPEDIIRIQNILKVCGELILLGERSILDLMIQNKPLDDSLLKIFILGFTKDQMRFIHIRREEIRPLFVLILAHVYSHPDIAVKQESTVDLAFSCYKEMMFSSAKGKVFLNTKSLTSESMDESQLCNTTACELLFEMYNLHQKYYTINYEVLFNALEK